MRALEVGGRTYARTYIRSRTSVVRRLSEPQITCKSHKNTKSNASAIISIIMRRPIIVIFAAVASVSFAQDYGDNYADYADGQQDNLYANYAAKQQAKEV